MANLLSLKKWFFRGLALLLLCYIISLFYIGISSSNQLPKDNKELNYILVLGAKMDKDGPSKALQYRLDATVDYVKTNNLKTPIIVSGGKGKDEPIAEAIGMKAYLVRNGIPANQIIVEDQSTSTAANFKNSKKLMTNGYNVLIVTTDFHIARARYLGEKQGLTVYTYRARNTADLLGLKAFLREPIAFLKTIVVD